ncbi:PE-PPE domain-containing protein [Mycolicibacterium sp.]|uniref:PE-PPE domain-containing protein n=1 Tax=Mycolicibacterium sp. TaxID=2320850 RepID=UPI003D144DA4
MTVVSLLGGLLLFFTTAMAPAWAGTALVVGGIGQPTVPDWVMSNLLKGRFQDDTRVDIEWPAEARPYTRGTHTLGQSVDIGTERLYEAIMNSEEPITVVGMSGGSLVVDETLRKLLANPNEAPAKEDLTFVIIADSSRQAFINRTKYSSRLDYTYQPAPETQYDVIVVTGEYDGFADFPDRWWNFTAVLNAYAGVLTEHIPTAFADLDTVPLENITITYNDLGGETKHYLVPAATLPLVKLFPGLKSREAELKRIIDSAYKRNDPVTGSNVATATAVAPTETEVVEEVVDEEPDTAALTETAKSAPATKESDDAVVEDVKDEAVVEDGDEAVTEDEDDAIAEDEDDAIAEDEDDAIAEDEDDAVADDDSDKPESASGDDEGSDDSADNESSGNADSSDSGASSDSGNES